VKLYYSATSPYVRKVMASAIARGIEDRITTVPVDAHSSPESLLAANPLSKVPCLVADDGFALFDSVVICEYLDSIGDAAPLFPPPGAARWRAIKYHAMGDGILDAALLSRMEGQRPREAARDAVIARQKAAIGRTLDQLENQAPARHLDIGSITIACALGYLDFRFAAEDWRANRPSLAAWYTGFATHPAIARTAPPS
jgi:glutathione S-transferase